MIVMSDVQPDVGLPKINVLIAKKIAKIIDAANVKKPAIEAIANGTSEKATIPSMEY